MQRFHAVEVLRAVLAWWVVINHALHLGGAFPWLPDWASYVLNKGEWAVAAFMVVSGFVVAHLLIEREEPYPVYLARRFFRLMPLLLVAMLIATLLREAYVMSFGNELAFKGDMRLDRMRAEDQLPFLHLFLHLTMLHGILPDALVPYASSTILSPAWSISVEWQFYVLAPLILAALVRPSRTGVATLGVLLVLSWLCLMLPITSWRYPSFLPLALPWFLAGMTTRLLFRETFPWFAIGVTLAAFFVYQLNNHHIAATGMMAVAALWGGCLLLTARERGMIPAGPAWLDRTLWLVTYNPVLLFMGRISYAVYLIHIPVMAATVAVAALVVGHLDRSVITIATFVSLPLVLLAATALYHLVEVTGIRMGSKVARRIGQRPVESTA